MHIYVHVPFCARRCSYCDFAIAVRRETPDRQFVDAIALEWRGVVDRELPISPVSTLYFGGGTPSRLDPSSIDALVRLVTMPHGHTPDAEITLETNPDDVTPARAAAWLAAGVNRVSLGVQSHDASVLEWMHRTHQAEQVPQAVALLREAGITNISIDMIFALPAELQRDWRHDLEQTLALAPQHLSLYGLTIEPRTPLARWTERGNSIALPDDRYATEYLEAHEMMTAAGFDHYEVSNAGQPGFRAKHNSTYWQGRDYIGLGPSAHSLASGTRRWNVREWADYHGRISRGESVVGGTELVGGDALALERRYLGLRTSDGLPASELPPGTPDRWQRSGWAIVTAGMVRLTPEGWLRLDALVAAG